MGRIRTVKPELFTHEDLFDLEKVTGMPMRVAFIGLFTCCDREGRFKWRPRTLKLAVLPHDEIDFSRVLDALATRGFIRKYAIDGEEFGVIPTFSKHQVINNRESESELPDPAEGSYISVTWTRDARVDDATGTPTQGKGRERKGKERKGREDAASKQAGLSLGLVVVDDIAKRDVVAEIFDYWKKIMLSPGSVLDDKRKKLIKSALKMGYSPADLCKAIRGCSKSPFHMGQNAQKTKQNHLGLIFRSAEYVDKFIGLDSGDAATANETMEQHNARVAAMFLGEDFMADEQTIEMEV